MSDVYQQGKFYHQEIETLARELHSELVQAAKALGMPEGPSVDEFLSVIRAMPVFDFVPAKAVMPTSPSWQRMFGKAMLRSTARRAVNSHLEKPLSETLSIYSGVLGEWTSSVLQVIEEQFSSFADGYRAQAERAQSEKLGAQDQNGLLQDLCDLGEGPKDVGVSVGSPNV